MKYQPAFRAEQPYALIPGSLTKPVSLSRGGIRPSPMSFQISQQQQSSNPGKEQSTSVMSAMAMLDQGNSFSTGRQQLAAMKSRPSLGGAGSNTLTSIESPAHQSHKSAQKPGYNYASTYADSQQDMLLYNPYKPTHPKRGNNTITTGGTGTATFNSSTQNPLPGSNTTNSVAYTSPLPQQFQSQQQSTLSQQQQQFALPKLQGESQFLQTNNNTTNNNTNSITESARKQEISSKTHLRNIVKYYNSNPIQSANNLQFSNYQLGQNPQPSNFFGGNSNNYLPSSQAASSGNRPPSNNNERILAAKRDSFGRSFLPVSSNSYANGTPSNTTNNNNGHGNNNHKSNSGTVTPINAYSQNTPSILSSTNSERIQQGQQHLPSSKQQVSSLQNSSVTSQQQQQGFTAAWQNVKQNHHQSQQSSQQQPSQYASSPSIPAYSASLLGTQQPKSQLLSPSKAPISNQHQSTSVQSLNTPSVEIEDLLDSRMLPKIEKSKISSKQNGVIHAYGANTHQGLVRPYNEDRVSIILNVVKPPEKAAIQDWPVISFFAVYDGHGGAACADFLRDHLHFFIIKDEEFPRNPQMALHNGFVKAEDAFLKIADSKIPLDKSGSCAIVIMIVDEKVFVGNLGDSRAVMSSNHGSRITDLSHDHKPNAPDEEKRILANGGKIYQSQFATQQPKPLPQFIKGPHRVIPGRLAVSRTVGDAEAKLRKYGGNPRVILAEPEVSNFQLSNDIDFILLGCDGIFDKLSSTQTIDYIWENMRDQQKRRDPRRQLHDYIGDGIEYLLKQTFMHKSFDNVTVVVLCLKNLEKLLP